MAGFCRFNHTRTPKKRNQSKSEPSKAAFWWFCTSARGPANDPVLPLPICRAGGKANQQPYNGSKMVGHLQAASHLYIIQYCELQEWYVPLSFTQLNGSTNHSKPPAITLPASKHQCQVTAWWGKSVSLGRSIVTLSRLVWASASTPSLATCRAYLDSGPSSKFATCGIQFAAFLHSHRFCTSRNSFYVCFL